MREFFQLDRVTEVNQMFIILEGRGKPFHQIAGVWLVGRLPQGRNCLQTLSSGVSGALTQHPN